MLSIGKRQPRALQSFGVAGLLSESCVIYYESFYSPQGLGRVSDLISARLQESAPDPLRLRALLLYCVFEAYQTQTQRLDAGRLDEPVVLECGVDPEAIALGVSFNLPAGFELNLNSLAETIAGPPSAVPFERLLQFLAQHGESLVIRFQPSIRRFEAVALLSVQASENPIAIQATAEIRTVLIEGEAQETPKAERYIQLADLNYSKLLAADSIKGKVIASPAGEILAKELAESIELGQAVVAGHDEGDESHLVKGNLPELSDDLIRVRGTANEERNSPYKLNEPKLTPAEAQLYEEKIVTLQNRVAELEALPSQSDCSPMPPLEGLLANRSLLLEQSNLVSSDGGGLGAFLNKFWPFKLKKAQPDTGEIEQLSLVEASSSSALEQNTDVRVDPGLKAVDEQETASSPEVAASNESAAQNVSAVNKMLSEIQSGGLDRTIDRVERESAQIQLQIENAKARKWVDSMAKELSIERFRVGELAKAATSLLRQRELEYRQKELSLRTQESKLVAELNNKEKALRHKDYSMTRLKEMVSQANAALDRLKATQTANQLSAKGKGRSEVEYTALQLRNERAQKQAEEFKKSNQQLMDRIAESQKDRDCQSASAGDLTKRLEISNRTMLASKKQAERLAQLVETMKRDDLRMKSDVQRTHAELKALKMARSSVEDKSFSSKKPGNDSNSPPNAA